MSQQFRRRTHSFIVRFWADCSAERKELISGQVERVGSGEKAHFRGASGLLKLFKRWTPQIDISSND